MDCCIVYIMGVSGSGKTTIGEKLAAILHLPFFDADDLHSPANKTKMRSGHPLTDEDRQEWLVRLNRLATEQSEKVGAVIACSALKKKYREVLSAGIRVPLYWVFLRGSYDLIKKRMEERQGHYMQARMLASQFEALEPPETAITVDISKNPDEIADTIIFELQHRKNSKSSG